ncbi:MAG: hypothetical protein ACOC7S_00885 [Planctomycetota bacterium]
MSIYLEKGVSPLAGFGAGLGRGLTFALQQQIANSSAQQQRQAQARLGEQQAQAQFRRQLDLLREEEASVNRRSAYRSLPPDVQQRAALDRARDQGWINETQYREALQKAKRDPFIAQVSQINERMKALDQLEKDGTLDTTTAQAARAGLFQGLGVDPASLPGASGPPQMEEFRIVRNGEQLTVSGYWRETEDGRRVAFTVDGEKLSEVEGPRQRGADDSMAARFREAREDLDAYFDAYPLLQRHAPGAPHKNAQYPAWFLEQALDEDKENRRKLMGLYMDGLRRMENQDLDMPLETYVGTQWAEEQAFGTQQVQSWLGQILRGSKEDLDEADDARISSDPDLTWGQPAQNRAVLARRRLVDVPRRARPFVIRRLAARFGKPESWWRKGLSESGSGDGAFAAPEGGLTRATDQQIEEAIQAVTRKRGKPDVGDPGWEAAVEAELAQRGLRAE